MDMPLEQDPDPELEAEVLRVNRRYLTEVVEHFGLCPWALRSRLDGAVMERVLWQKSSEFLAPSLAALDAMLSRRACEIGLFIYPHVPLGRLEFERFVRALREADTARHPVGEAPLVMAAFHPDAHPNLSDAERLIPYLRRTPYPTIQIVRRAALERVRGDEEEGTAYLDVALVAAPPVKRPVRTPLRERIARVNLATLEASGLAAFEEVFADIFRDRDRVLARLAGDKRA